MKENGKNIDDLFRENLDDYSETPRASVWSDVERKLDDSDHKTGGAVGFGPGAKILLLLVAATALFFTAKWAMGRLGKHDAATPGIVITNESASRRASNETVNAPINQPHTDSVITKNISPTSIPKGTDSTAASAISHKSMAVTNPVVSMKSSGSKNFTGPIPEKETENENINANENAAQSATATRGKNKSKKSGSAGAGTTLMLPAAGSATVNPIKQSSTANIRQQVPVPLQQPNVADNTKAEKVVVPEPYNNIDKVVRDKSDIAQIYANSTFVSIGAKPDEPVLNMYSPDLQRLLKRLRRSLTKAGIEGGLKLGFEAGFSFTAEKLVIAPYLQYNVSPVLSLVLQPGIKYVHLKNTEMVPQQSYYDITNSTVTTGHTIIKGDSITSTPDTITRRYFYKETSDSIRIGFNTAKKNYFEFELPVLLQARITQKLSVFGGISFSFNKVVQVIENKQVYSGITRSDSVIYNPVAVTAPAPVPPSGDSVFRHTAQTLSNYTGNTLQNPSSDPMKIGYMLGFSYKLKDRWSVELMMQQMLSNAAYIPDDKVRSLYKQPYFRISVGYRLFKTKP